MSNPFTVAEQDLIKAGSFILQLSEKALSIFKAGQPAEVAAVKLLSAVESFISLAAPAVGSEGLNFPADSAAYAQFLVVVADAKAFVAAAEGVEKAAKA